MLNKKHRGNEIYRDESSGIFKYVDDDMSVSENHFIKPCGNCGRSCTPEGSDGCLGTLIGTMNACCGHGEDESAYIQFLDGNIISGKDAKIIHNILRDYSRAKEGN